MQIVGFYCFKAKENKSAKVKEIQIDVDKTVMQAAVTFNNGKWNDYSCMGRTYS